MITAHKELAVKLTELERQVASHDSHIRSLFEAKITGKNGDLRVHRIVHQSLDYETAMEYERCVA